MDYRGLVLVVALVGSCTLGLTVSCTAPDPGEITFSERPKSGISSGDPVGTSSSGDVDGGGSSSGGTDGGSSSGGPVTAFSGAPAYAAGAANGSSNNGNHPTGNVGINCQDCHKNGGTAPAWGIAGTVYAAATGAAIVAQAEVRLVGPTGTELSKVYTDALGNFWSDPIPGGIPAGSKIGVRNGTATKLMATALAGDNDGACHRAGCHAAGAQGHVFLN
jgi:hypothetical protein